MRGHPNKVGRRVSSPLGCCVRRAPRPSVRKHCDSHSSSTRVDPHFWLCPYHFEWQGLESTDTAGFQSFDLTGAANQYVTSIGIQMKGTGSGAPGFAMLDAYVFGTKLDNPTDTFYVSVREGMNE